MAQLGALQFRWLVIPLAVCLAYGSFAYAQDIQHFEPALGTANYLSVDGAKVAGPKQLVLTTFITHSSNPLVERRGGPEGEIRHVGGLTTLELVGAYAINERSEVGLALPFGFANRSRDLDVDDGDGLGDLRLATKFILLGATRSRGLGVAVAVPMSFPTGTEEYEFSERYFTIQPRLVIEYRSRWWRLSANAGYRWLPTRGDDLPALGLGAGVTYGGALGVMPGTRWMEFIVESFGTAYAEAGGEADPPHPAELLLGARIFGDHGLAVMLGGGGGLTQDFSAPEFRVIGALSWAMNLDDQSGGQRGVMALVDSDGDGIKDSADNCPERPEDLDGFEDRDGCPEPDNDGDGKPDAVDDCPSAPEDIDGYADDDGCPDVDNDRDGIFDIHDRCPLHPEMQSDRSNRDGCPDQTVVVVEENQIRHLQKIYFETGKAAIRAGSFFVLDQVAAAILAHSDIEQVSIEGHTDAHGDTEQNDALSQQRAESVRRYLVQSGVPAERLKIVGHGERKLIGDGLNRQDAHLSRRVEFIIVKRRADAPADSTSKKEDKGEDSP
ncbi:MAG: OmpA family protein [Myxococcota bacterium]|nr:OmpA family protein [Myxococcota bacterium]